MAKQIVSAKKKNAEPGHLDFLDGVRGGAALWVVVAHCLIWGSSSFRLPNPKIAVDFFIVVSGYLMMYMGMKREGNNPQKSSMAVQFWIRRFFRIAPLYYLLLTAAFAFGWLFIQGTATLQAVDPHSWAQRYLPSHLNFSWSSWLMHISFFIRFVSLLFFLDSAPRLEHWLGNAVLRRIPHSFFIVPAHPAGGCVSFALCPWICGNPAYSHIFGTEAFLEPSFLPQKFSLFVVGITLASVKFELVRRPWEAAVMVAAVLVVVSRNSLYVVSLVLIFLLMMSNFAGENRIVFKALKNVCGKVLGNRLTRLMADASYSVYLSHMFFILLVGGWLYRQPAILKWPLQQRMFLLTAITLVGSYLAAWALYSLVEKPGIELGRRILQSRFFSSAAPKNFVVPQVPQSSENIQ